MIVEALCGNDSEHVSILSLIGLAEKKFFIKGRLVIYTNRSSRPEVFCKKGVLRPFLLKKETLAQVFSCEFCEIFKNNFLYRTPPVAASVLTIHEKTNCKQKKIAFM